MNKHMSLTFTSENFEGEVLKSSEPVLVDFWASWCGPCQMMVKVIDELAEDNAGKPVKIGKCNVDEQREIAEKYDIMSIPAFFLFKNGQVIEKTTGALPKIKLQEMLDKNM